MRFISCRRCEAFRVYSLGAGAALGRFFYFEKTRHYHTYKTIKTIFVGFVGACLYIFIYFLRENALNTLIGFVGAGDCYRVS